MARKVVVSEMEVKNTSLSGEIIMESFGSTEEEVKMNNPEPAPHLNSCTCSPSLKEAWKPASVSSAVIDNCGSERNSEIVKETEDSNDGSVKPYSPSGV